jgi:hypothetical protein
LIYILRVDINLKMHILVTCSNDICGLILGLNFFDGLKRQWLIFLWVNIYTKKNRLGVMVSALHALCLAFIFLIKAC